MPEGGGTISSTATDSLGPRRAAARPFPPTPAATLLQHAADRLATPRRAHWPALIAADYPRSLERRPAQLLTAAGASAEDLDRLVRAAGFADLDDVRRQAAERVRRPVGRAATCVSPTAATASAPDRPGLDHTLRREQDNLAETLRVAATVRLAGTRRPRHPEPAAGGGCSAISSPAGYAQLFATDLTSALGVGHAGRADAPAPCSPRSATHTGSIRSPSSASAATAG